MLIQPGASDGSVGPMEPLGPIEPQPMPESQIESLTIGPVIESGQSRPAGSSSAEEQPKPGVRQVGFLSRISGSGSQKKQEQQPVEPEQRRGWLSPLFR